MDAPCRTKVIPREIPVLPWYQSRGFYLFIGGFLPFFSIGIELYYIFLTLWGRYVYQLYEIVCVVFVLVVIVTACVSVTLTYCLLSCEDYRWWWASFWTTGFTSFFVFLYSILHFRDQNMSGIVQGSHYFGYTILLCYSIFLMLGFIGFYSSKRFDLYIYSTIKFD